jgi:ribosomal protein S18 acetylase RimI-like enzyme
MAIKLREFQKTDRSKIDTLLSRIPAFNASDRMIAMELVDVYLNQLDQKDYYFFVAANEDDVPIGYTCYGPAPLTDRTYDLYWIGVDPEYSGKGIGTLLLKETEDAIKAKNGRMITLDTSSSQEYSPARQFYLKNGYECVCIISDYYRKGEDKVIFLKKLRDDY